MDEMEKTPISNNDLLTAQNLLKNVQNYQILELEKNNVALEKEVLISYSH